MKFRRKLPLEGTSLFLKFKRSSRFYEICESGSCCIELGLAACKLCAVALAEILE